MMLVVGLGNPGPKYLNTRHNVGYWVVDELSKGHQWKPSKSTGALSCWLNIGDSKVELLKPQKFMNRSGLAVKGVRKKHPKLELKNIYVIHDDLDIPLGEYKLSFGKGPRVHNGLKSVYEQVGSKDFWHVRLGIDNRLETGFTGSGEEYVLGKWRPKERKIIKEVISKVIVELNNVLA